MPEIAEVEAQRLKIEKHAVGLVITRVIVTEQGGGPRNSTFDSKVFGETVGDGAEVEAVLTGMRIHAALRKGKQLWLELARPGQPVCGALLLHFGMAGKLVPRSTREEHERPSDRSRE